MNLIKPFVAWSASKGIVSPLEIRCVDNEASSGARYTAFRPDAAINNNNESSEHVVTLVQCPLSACLRASSPEDLARVLSKERSLGAASDFAPYIDLLPQPSAESSSDSNEYSSSSSSIITPFLDLPRFWTSDRLDRAVDDGALKAAVQRDRARVESVDDRWALACVDSRANILPDGSYALTPLLDFINHDATVETSARVVAVSGDDDGNDDTANNEETLYLEIAATSAREQAASVGSEIRMSYGDMTNLQTLLNYGFVAVSDDNGDDSNTSDDNPYNVEGLLVRSVVLDTPILVEMGNDGRADPVALGMLRRSLATPDELESVNFGSLVPFLSDRNELETYALIAGTLDEALYDVQQGIRRCTRDAEDPLLSRYMTGRRRTLKMALTRIQTEFPELYE